MGVENFYIEKGSAESASPESICLDVKSGVIFSSGCFLVKDSPSNDCNIRPECCNIRLEVNINGKKARF